MTRQQRFIILGTGGFFTYKVIHQLLQKACKPLAFIHSARQFSAIDTTFANIKVESPRPETDLSRLLQQHAIQTLYYPGMDLKKFIQQQHIEYLLVACWPTLINDDIIQSVTKAALNLHPSLLPDFRGFDPVNDQLKSANANFGVSLHLLSERYDCGDIVLQQAYKQPHYLTRQSIESESARLGADLFIRALHTYDKPGWKLLKQTVD